MQLVLKRMGDYLGVVRQRPLLLLLIILGAFLFVSVLFIQQIPPFEGPDEAQHFAYVVWLAQGNGLPPQGESAWETPIQQEAGQPPLYYFLASLPARLTDLENYPAIYRPNPYFAAPLGREQFDNDNRALHYPKDERPLRGGWAAFYAARVLSTLFGLMLITSTYGIARYVIPQQPAVALGAALFIATMPQVVHIATVVSNDIPAAALSTFSLYLWVKWLRQQNQKGIRGAVWPGLVLGLAALTKVSALAVGAVWGAGLLWLGLTKQRPWREVIIIALWLGVGFGAAVGWWLGRGWLLYGAPGGLTPHYGTTWAIINAAEQLPPMLERWLEVGRSFWLALGWGTVRPAGWVYRIYGLMVLVGIGGAMAFWVRQRDNKVAVWLGMLWIGVLATAVALEFWMRQVTAPHGRLLYPALAPIALTLSLGWQTMLRRWQFVPYLFSGVWVLVAGTVLVQAAYYPPPLLAPPQLPPNSLAWQLSPPAEAPLVELLAAEPLSNALQAGNVLPVRLCWRVLRATEQEYVVFLHLIGPENSVVASRRSYPGQGLRPTSLWQPQQAWCEVNHLYVPPEVAPTLVYQLEIGMIDPQTGERLLVYDSQGMLLAPTYVDRVKVVAATAIAPPPAASDLGGYSSNLWQLTAFTTTPVWKTGTAVPLTLYWQISAAIHQDYQTFVHLRQIDNGEIVAQADGPPLEGWYPTSWWEPGETIMDPRVFSVPETLPPGNYQLVIGFYDLATTHQVGEPFNLGTIEVQP